MVFYCISCYQFSIVHSITWPLHYLLVHSILYCKHGRKIRISCYNLFEQSVWETIFRCLFTLYGRLKLFMVPSQNSLLRVLKWNPATWFSSLSTFIYNYHIKSFILQRLDIMSNHFIIRHCCGRENNILLVKDFFDGLPLKYLHIFLQLLSPKSQLSFLLFVLFFWKLFEYFLEFLSWIFRNLSCISFHQ